MSFVSFFGHQLCFDAIASTAIYACKNGLGPGTFSFTGCRPGEQKPLEGKGKIVVLDLPYRPEAHFWADHHVTAFGDQKAPPTLVRGRHCYDPQAKSCAGLLARTFWGSGGPLRELASWADVIDGALFESPRVAVAASNPMVALRTLAETLSDPLGLIHELASGTSPREIAQRCQGKALNGSVDLTRFIRPCMGKVAYHNLSGHGPGWYNKLAPYAASPDCVYSVVVSRGLGGGIGVAVGRNRWNPGAGVENLGLLCQQRARGGGHHNAGGFGGPAEKLNQLIGVAQSIVEHLHRCG